MTIDNGTKLHVAANVSETIDGIDLELPAGDYRALAVGPVGGEEAGDEVERFLLLPVGRERAHPISAEGLAQLAAHERVEVTETN